MLKKELHGYYKNEFEPQNDLERAKRWYYLNRTSYSGIMNMKNCYWGYGDKYSMRPENWGRNIRRTSQKLQNVNITNLDFEEVISSAPDGAFLFVFGCWPASQMCACNFFLGRPFPSRSARRNAVHHHPT